MIASIKIWLLEDYNGYQSAYRKIEDAYDAARRMLVEYGCDPISDHDKELFDQLDDSYNNESYGGFYVDDLLWCGQIDYNF